MRVLLTGGAGLIGRAALTELLAAGHEVTILDRSVTRFRDVIDVRHLEGDTCDSDVVERAMTGQDRVVHLAAGASFLMYERNPVGETTGATAGFHTILDAAVRADVSRVVFASTSAVYEGNKVPYHERMDLHPPDLKALAKKVNEEVAYLYSSRYGLQTLALRPFSVYGVDEESKGPYANVASLFAWAMVSGRRPLLWGTGSQTRDFIFAEDVGRAISLAVVSQYTGVINIGTGVETSFDDLISALNQLLGSDLEPEHIQVPISIYATRLLADPQLASDSLGFTAKVDLRSGLARVLEHVHSLDEDTRKQLSTLQEAFRAGVKPRTAGTAGPGRSLSAA